MCACPARHTGVQIHRMHLPSRMQWGWQGRCAGWEIDTWAPKAWVFMLSQSFGGGVGEAAVPEEVLPTSSSLAPTFSFSYVSSPPLLHPRKEQRRPFWVRGPEGRGPVVTCFEITTTACQVLGEGRGWQGRAGQAGLGCQSGLQPAYCLTLQAPSLSTLHLHPLPEVNR